MMIYSLLFFYLVIISHNFHTSLSFQYASVESMNEVERVHSEYAGIKGLIISTVSFVFISFFLEDESMINRNVKTLYYWSSLHLILHYTRLNSPPPYVILHFYCDITEKMRTLPDVVYNNCCV